METIIAYVLAAWFVFSGLATVAYVGKRRDPITPGIAVATVVVQLLTVLGVLYVADII